MARHLAVCFWGVPVREARVGPAGATPLRGVGTWFRFFSLELEFSTILMEIDPIIDPI